MLRLTDERSTVWRRWLAELLTSPGRDNLATEARRNRSRTCPLVEFVEDRVLLSAVDLRSAKGVADAEVFRAQKSAVLITSVSGGGVKGGQAFLTATLTSQGLPLAGRTIFFQVRGVPAGKAITDGNGVAMRYLANLRNVPVGFYARGIGAGFAGNSTYKSTISHGPLLVSRLPATISGVTASGVYQGVATIGATMTSRGAAVVGQTVQFEVMGHVVGTAVTDSQGIATLGGVSLAGFKAGAYANAVSADFVGSFAFTSSSALGLLVVSPAQLGVSGITANNKVYDGTTHASLNTGSAVLVGMMPGDVVTLDSSGATGTFATKNVGTGITVTVSGLSLSGPQAGNYIVGPVTTQANITASTLTVTGITAENKPYDGTTTAVLNTSAAALVGVVPGDSVTLNTSAAVGMFVSPAIGTGKTVLISGLTVTGADAGNYVLVQPTATADITAGNVIVTGITASNKVYDANTDATLNLTGATISGVAPGDSVSLVTTGAVGTFATPDAGIGVTVNVTGLTLTGADAGKYTLVPPTTTANITPKLLTVTGITGVNKIYDGTTTATVNTTSASLVGVIPGDTATLNTSGATGTFATKDVGTGITVTVSGLSLAGVDAANYAITEPTTTANITPAALNVTGITAANKPYDGTTAATLTTSGATLEGVAPGDTVTLVTTGATGAFATKNVGTGITVIVSGLSLSGADAANYTLTQPPTTADITPAPLEVTGITASNKTYDRTAAAMINTSGAKLEGVVSGDTVTLVTSGATGAFATPGAGTGITVLVSGLMLSGASAGNYALTEPTTTANITPAAVDVNGITAANKPYDGTTAAMLNITGAMLQGVLNGDTVTLVTSGAIGTFATPNVGTGITVLISGLSLSGADAGNYALTEPTTTANITPAAVDVNGITAANKTYNGSTTATLNTSGAVLVGAVPGDSVSLNTSGATGTFMTANVGTGIAVIVNGLALSGSSAGNYNLIQPTTMANITPRALDVTGITASSKIYDGTTDADLNTAAATLMGLVPGDIVTLITGGATGAFVSKNVGTGITVNISGLLLSGPQAGNYSLTEPTTTANISAKALDVNGITAASKTYDGKTTATLNTSGATLLGVVSGDSVTLVTTGATGTFVTKDVGTGITVLVSGLSISGADAGNYSLSEPTTTADITPAALNVAGITAQDKIYDSTTDATLVTSGAALEGVVSGDTVTLDSSGAMGTFASPNVGTGITVLVSGLLISGADAGNYSLTEPTTTSDIMPRALDVNGISASDKTYDGSPDATLDTSGAMLVGVISSDMVTLVTSGAVGTFTSPNVGTGITVLVSGLSITGADAANYSLSEPTTAANITPATLDVSGITASNMTYDGSTEATLSTGSAALVGVVHGDVVTLDVSGAMGTFATKNVGTGITVTVSGLTLAGASAGNYILVEPMTTANITAAMLTVTGITAEDKAFDGNTDATLDTSGAMLMGVVNGDTVMLDTSGAVGTFANDGPGTDIPVMITGLVINGADAGNYILEQPATTASIT